MGVVTREMLEFGLMDPNSLVKVGHSYFLFLFIFLSYLVKPPSSSVMKLNSQAGQTDTTFRILNAGKQTET